MLYVRILLFTYFIRFNFPVPSNQRVSNIMEEQITLTTLGKIAIITLNVEKKLNALTMDLYCRLSSLMREVATREDIYITILTGKGRYFSAYDPTYLAMVVTLDTRN